MTGACAEGWITAIGTATAGLSAAVALCFAIVQFRRGGFVYRVRLTIDNDYRVVRLAVENTGRMQGHIEYIEIQNRRSLKVRVGLAVRRQAGSYETVPGELWAASQGSRLRTIQVSPTPTGDVAIDLPAGHSFVAHIVRSSIDGSRGRDRRDAHLPFISSTDNIQNRHWLLVRVGFGDGRVASAVPTRNRSTYIPVGMVG
jgi:hypothetical protein